MDKNKVDKNRLLLICYNDKLTVKYANIQKVLIPVYKGSLFSPLAKEKIALFKRGE